MSWLLLIRSRPRLIGALTGDVVAFPSGAVFGPPRTPPPPWVRGRASSPGRSPSVVSAGGLSSFSPVGHTTQSGLTACIVACIMAHMAPPSTFDLYDRLLNGRLTNLLADGRAGGLSFEDIAFRLRSEGVEVSASTVRRWCAEQGVTGPDEAA